MEPALPVIEAELGPGVRGFFTTRRGGVSAEPWASLNLGFSVGDDREHVLGNREIVADEAGAPLVIVGQVHGSDVVDADLLEPERLDADPGSCLADALVGSRTDHALAVTVADCVPVILADVTRGVVAVVHAGRAGIVVGIVGRAVATMRARGATQIRAAVGPCACVRCYEVPVDLRDAVVAIVPEAFGTTRQGTAAVDLRAAVTAQLTTSGVTQVKQVDICTIENDDLYSHRRATASGSVTGRGAAVVRLLPR